jgi:hypothetical protein
MKLKNADSHTITAVSSELPQISRKFKSDDRNGSNFYNIKKTPTECTVSRIFIVI